MSRAAVEQSERRPFEPGNRAAVKSGAWSPALVAETVEELRPWLQLLIDEASWLTLLDRDTLEDYLTDRARLLRLERWLAEHGDRYPDGHEHAGELRDRDHRELNTIKNRLRAYQADLGLNPTARGRLVSSLAVAGSDDAIAALKAAGREALDAGDDGPEAA